MCSNINRGRKIRGKGWYSLINIRVWNYCEGKDWNMLVKTRCEYCESEDLSLIDMVYGKGTLGERIEKGFKCNSCDEELDLDEVIFEEV